eukprot:3935098-Rhodomonas_salina.1
MARAGALERRLLWLARPRSTLRVCTNLFDLSLQFSSLGFNLHLVPRPSLALRSETRFKLDHRERPSAGRRQHSRTPPRLVPPHAMSVLHLAYRARRQIGKLTCSHPEMMASLPGTADCYLSTGHCIACVRRQIAADLACARTLCVGWPGRIIRPVSTRHGIAQA